MPFAHLRRSAPRGAHAEPGAARFFGAPRRREDVLGAYTALSELKAAGKKPYFIPGGGSNAIGSLGYVKAALSIVEASRAAELAEKKGMDDAKTGVSLERTKKLAEARQRKLGWDHKRLSSRTNS